MVGWLLCTYWRFCSPSTGIKSSCGAPSPGVIITNAIVEKNVMLTKTENWREALIIEAFRIYEFTLNCNLLLIEASVIFVKKSIFMFGRKKWSILQQMGMEYCFVGSKNYSIQLTQISIIWEQMLFSTEAKFPTHVKGILLHWKQASI
jgi:hypothetical protein